MTAFDSQLLMIYRFIMYTYMIYCGDHHQEEKDSFVHLRKIDICKIMKAHAGLGRNIAFVILVGEYVTGN